MVLVLDDVIAGYGSIEILHGISTRFEASDITSLIGPNGSGKSTLLKTIVGMLKPRRGQIIFNGEDLAGLRPDLVLRRGIALVLQIRSVFPHMPVKENLEMGAYILRDPEEIRERMEEVYNRFPILKEREDQLAYTLSGGEQRMLELGRALMLHPKMLLLDEPSAMLAPKFRDMVFQKVKEINREGIGIILVEQNVREALKLADRVNVLDLGKIVFKGTRDELMKSDLLVKLYLGG